LWVMNGKHRDRNGTGLDHHSSFSFRQTLRTRRTPFVYTGLCSPCEKYEKESIGIWTVNVSLKLNHARVAK
jgi:hypothetical protein